MKKIFYAGLVALGLFEIFKIYFIMPMPGSQQVDTVEVAYILHVNRWYFRVTFAAMILAGSLSIFRGNAWWKHTIPMLLVLAVVLVFNFKMVADKMFLQPHRTTFKPRSENALSDSTVVLAVAINGEAKAYPLRYIIYHHQVRDTVAEKPVMITYCSVCRTGRVFDPMVSGKNENFRLVGMDHFNAMFEDATTGSWWQQATGEAITGPLKGVSLIEIPSIQLTASKFFSLYPFGLMMQPEEISTPHYDTLGNYEWGKSKSKLTGTDSISWSEKAWVIGIQKGNEAKAYDWNLLKEKRIIHDNFDQTPIVMVLSTDEQSFAVFERKSESEIFQIQNDTLSIGGKRYDLLGRNVLDETDQLRRLQAYQEFWHSWRTFHPDTKQFQK